ncbi:MAG TPA: hypothetical protein VHH53_03565, partial [Pseudonocardiaceae bacterium]|nr:hypothetical protein [Pseudonocardiaceae bacterium]
QLAPTQAETQPPPVINLADYQVRRRPILGGLTRALSSLKGLDLSSCAAPRLVDLFSFVLRRFWAAPVAASGSRIGPVGPTASAAAGP